MPEPAPVSHDQSIAQYCHDHTDFRNKYQENMEACFIGLGSMAANLQKAGYKLVVHDIREASATPNLNAGAKWADSPKSVAAQCKVILISLPGPPEVEAVALGPNGLIEGMKKGVPGLISPPTHRPWCAGCTSCVKNAA